jgi:hypothetical protein
VKRISPVILGDGAQKKRQSATPISSDDESAATWI